MAFPPTRKLLQEVQDFNLTTTAVESRKSETVKSSGKQIVTVVIWSSCFRRKFWWSCVSYLTCLLSKYLHHKSTVYIMQTATIPMPSPDRVFYSREHGLSRPTTSEWKIDQLMSSGELTLKTVVTTLRQTQRPTTIPKGVVRLLSQKCTPKHVMVSQILKVIYARLDLQILQKLSISGSLFIKDVRQRWHQYTTTSSL